MIVQVEKKKDSSVTQMQYAGFHDKSGLFRLNHSDKVTEITTHKSQLTTLFDWYCFKENRNIQKECDDCVQEGGRYRTCGS